MGRLVIIGNGFDLAHGLKTSYKDLMEFIRKEIDVTNFRSIDLEDCGLIHHKFKKEVNPYIGFLYNSYGRDYKLSTCNKSNSIYFSDLFLDFNKYQKWGDLESLYFRLINIYKKDSDRIIKINDEFDYLKKLLEDYLYNQVEDKLRNYDFKDDNVFETRFGDTEGLIGIVNFNYTTRIIKKYISDLNGIAKQFNTNFELVNIHGELLNNINPIIFGYGDDNSDEYKVIQDAHNNELLKNFKTFQYLRNSNYIQALALLEMNKNIKVEIIGHSCGLADKTLLKTIFEHPNVSRIEYRYHSDESHYFQNLYNMSRIFTDNELMRKKVIDLDNTRKIEFSQLELSKT